MHRPDHSNGNHVETDTRLLLDNPPPPGRIVLAMEPGLTPCANELRRRCEAAGHVVTEIDLFEIDPEDVARQADLTTAAGVLGLSHVGLTDALFDTPSSTPGAGPSLLDSAIEAGIPLVVAPGGLDHVRFGARKDIPLQYSLRQILEVSDTQTLMRTSILDNAQMGRLLAGKINEAVGPVAVCLPLRGLSALDTPGGPFFQSEANMVLFGNLTTHLDRDVRLYDCNVNINDPAFAQLCFETLEVLVRGKSTKRKKQS